MSDMVPVPRTKIIRHADDAWVVACRICGKRARRVFVEARSDDPKGAALAYWDEHEASKPHAAALVAYRAPVADLDPQEILLREIFGKPEIRDEDDWERRRLRAARDAYWRASRATR